MPQHSRRDCAPRTPCARDATDAIEIWDRAHPLHFADRRDEREVARGPDVGAPERHQEIDIRGPRADASQLDQLCARTFVVHLCQTARIELARDDRHREPSDVRRLLSRKARASQVRFGQGGDPLRRHRTGESLESSVGGAAS